MHRSRDNTPLSTTIMTDTEKMNLFSTNAEIQKRILEIRKDTTKALASIGKWERHFENDDDDDELFSSIFDNNNGDEFAVVGMRPSQSSLLKEINPMEFEVVFTDSENHLDFDIVQMWDISTSTLTAILDYITELIVKEDE